MSKASTVHIGRHQIGRFRFLLWSLMMMIGLQPLLDEWIGVRIWADVFTDVFFGFALMSGLHAISEQPRQLQLSLFLAAAIILLKGLFYTLAIYSHPLEYAELSIFEVGLAGSSSVMRRRDHSSLAPVWQLGQ